MSVFTGNFVFSNHEFSLCPVYENLYTNCQSKAIAVVPLLASFIMCRSDILGALSVGVIHILSK